MSSLEKMQVEDPYIGVLDLKKPDHLMTVWLFRGIKSELLFKQEQSQSTVNLILIIYLASGEPGIFLQSRQDDTIILPCEVLHHRDPAHDLRNQMVGRYVQETFG
jgi:hypothetical protein